jgi:hypothetical protein
VRLGCARIPRKGYSYSCFPQWQRPRLKNRSFHKAFVRSHPQANHSILEAFGAGVHCMVSGLAREPQMASWQEIDRIRKDPKKFRALAARLLAPISELTEWEKDFLDSIKIQTDKDEFTTRQSEKLLQIRDEYGDITELSGGFSVRAILRGCRDARLDLSEDDEEWILQRFEESQTIIRRKHAGRLRRCARQLRLIEDDYGKTA